MGIGLRGGGGFGFSFQKGWGCWCLRFVLLKGGIVLGLGFRAVGWGGWV